MFYAGHHTLYSILLLRLEWGQWQWTTNQEEAVTAMEAAGVEPSGKGGGYMQDDFDVNSWQKKPVGQPAAATCPYCAEVAAAAE